MRTNEKYYHHTIVLYIEYFEKKNFFSPSKNSLKNAPSFTIFFFRKNVFQQYFEGNMIRSRRINKKR